MARKENALDLAKFIDKGVRVKLSGGREVEGLLKGYDQLLNLVLDETNEFVRDKDDPTRITDETRKLGLVVLIVSTLAEAHTEVSNALKHCLVAKIMLYFLHHNDGAEEIANPFLGEEDAEATED